MKKLVSGIFVMMTLLVQVVLAQKPAVVVSDDPGWQRIGQITASFKTTSESIVVLGADEFQAIKLKVTDAPIHIDRVQVFYESGDMEELEVASELREGGETQVLNLSNPHRDIKKVAFTYRTLPNQQGDKADVELYGLKAANDGSNAYRKDDIDKAGDKAKAEADSVDAEVDSTGNYLRKDVDSLESDMNDTREEIKQESNEMRSDIDSAANKTGDEISEHAAKGAAEIKDRRHDTKVGPHGEVIYIDRDIKYYYIDDKGKKVYVTEAQMKNKPVDR